MPKAESIKPPHQQRAETKPALRGPTRSSQPPQIAEAAPRKTKNRAYTMPSSVIFQSQLVVKSEPKSGMSGGQATGSLPFTARVSGSQNTLKPYAMPMHKWIASAAGGASQRLNAGPATMRSFESGSTPLVTSPVSAPAAPIMCNFSVWIALSGTTDGTVTSPNQRVGQRTATGGDKSPG